MHSEVWGLYTIINDSFLNVRFQGGREPEIADGHSQQSLKTIWALCAQFLYIYRLRNQFYDRTLSLHTTFWYSILVTGSSRNNLKTLGWKRSCMTSVMSWTTLGNCFVSNFKKHVYIQDEWWRILIECRRNGGKMRYNFCSFSHCSSSTLLHLVFRVNLQLIFPAVSESCFSSLNKAKLKPRALKKQKQWTNALPQHICDKNWLIHFKSFFARNLSFPWERGKKLRVICS